MHNKNIGLYFFIIFVFLFSSRFAGAITINFDDPKQWDSEDFQLRNEYAALGVIFQAGYLMPGSGAVTGPGIYFTFVGELPTYVSFITNNLDEYKNSAEAKGPNGYEEMIITEGSYRGTLPDDERNTPYIPNQQIVFRSEFGISSIGVSSQTSPFVDDLIFYYAKESVPEPSLAGLFILGLSGVLFRNRKFFCRKQ
ncbi:MAG TPA: PEP-CTERM sorting domain-containing protein [Cellvibrio sp.]|nr:PEP-CTERM sorting domain-containing protein [Cellvibrio sp.]